MKQTAVKLLFEEFKALSQSMRDAGDELSANLIDFLCEREEQALEMEKQQIIDFAYSCSHSEMTKEWIIKIYEQTYGGKNE